jgi:cellobiose phosphorylase
VDPCIPKKWKGFKVTRVFRGEIFDIEVRNPRGVSKGVRRITMDGQEVSGPLLVPTGDGRRHAVDVELG